MFRGLKFKLIAGAVGAALVVLAILILTGAITPFREKPVSGELVVWGREELGRTMPKIIDEYSSVQKGVRVSYEIKQSDTYDAETINALVQAHRR